MSIEDLDNFSPTVRKYREDIINMTEENGLLRIRVAELEEKLAKAGDAFDVDWSLAPTINGQPAIYHTWQEDGQQTWYTTEPELGHHYWNAKGPYTHSHFIANWRESLRYRPEGA